MKDTPGSREAPIPVFSIDPGPYFEANQTSLLYYWDLIVFRKAFIALTTAMFGFAGLILIFMMSWEYEALVYVLPPGEQTILEIVLPTIGGGLETHRVDPQAIYKSFLSYLESRSRRREYFDSKELLPQLVSEVDESINVQAVFERRFHEKLNVIREEEYTPRNVARRPGPVTLSMIAPGAELAAQWSNEFVSIANRATVNGYLESLQRRIQTRILALQDEIDGKRSVAQKRRTDRVAVLSEAVLIARRLGIQNPLDSPLLLQSRETAVSVHTQSPPLYMRGGRALQHEIQVLSGRESDDPFIGELRHLEERISRLRNIDLTAISMSAAFVDQAAFPPLLPVSPRILKTIALVLMAGFVLEIAVVIGRDTVRKQRRRDLESAGRSRAVSDAGSRQASAKGA